MPLDKAKSSNKAELDKTSDKISGRYACRLTGQIINFIQSPFDGSDEQAITHYSRGSLVINDKGKIDWLGDSDNLPEKYRALPVDDYGDKIILPGFIDPHIHFPQYRMLAAPGKDLLDWLNRFTFPEEARYCDAAFASAAAERFLDRLLACGTTSALAFSTVHSESVNALFAAASKRGMALITGKTLMDRQAPDNICDDAISGIDDSQTLIDKWHANGRLKYAITPRFAITSTDEQLKNTGALYANNPDCLMQTHLSESIGEIEAVNSLFPWAKDYTDVYDKYGLLGPNSLFAHGVHLSDREIARLGESRSRIIHCPSSNNFLGSGLFNLGKIANHQDGLTLGLATDIGAGTSFSMLQTIAEAYKVAMLQGYKLSAIKSLYMATLGNATAIGQEKEVGSFETGKYADIVVLDPNATETLCDRQALSDSIEDVLFALIILGDDRATTATYVAGNRLFQKT